MFFLILSEFKCGKFKFRIGASINFCWRESAKSAFSGASNHATVVRVQGGVFFFFFLIQIKLHLMFALEK